MSSLIETVIAPRGQYAADRVISDAIELPTDHNSLECEWANDGGWPDEARALMRSRCEMSFDGGRTWSWHFGFRAKGQRSRLPDGSLSSLSRMRVRGIPGEIDRIPRLVRLDHERFEPMATKIVLRSDALPVRADPKHNSVAFDAITEVEADNVLSFTATHTPVGTPTAVGALLTVYVDTYTIDSIAYGGAAMALEVTSPSSNTVNDRIYGLPNPASGAQTFGITFSNGAYFYGGIVTVTGSDTTQCFRTSSSDSAAATSGTTTSATSASATDDLVISIGGCDVAGSTLTAGAGQTERAAETWLLNTFQLASISTEPGASSVVMDYAIGNSTNSRTACTSFKVAAAGGTRPVKMAGAWGGYAGESGGFAG